MLRMMTTTATLIALSVPAYAEMNKSDEAMTETAPLQTELNEVGNAVSNTVDDMQAGAREIADDVQAGAAEVANDLSEATENWGDDVAKFDATTMQTPEGWTQVSGGAWTADELTGLPLYDATNTWVGEIDNVVITAEGDVKGAVLGVGGFLGVGEKDVLVSFDSLVFRQAQDGDEIRVYADVTKEGLEALPSYGS